MTMSFAVFFFVKMNCWCCFKILLFMNTFILFFSDSFTMTTINSIFAKSAAATVSNNNTTSAETDVVLKDQVVISDNDSDDSVDYAVSNAQNTVQLPPTKTLNLRVNKNKPKQSILVQQDKLGDFVTKVSYYIQKKVGKFDILYPAKCKNNKSTQWLSLVTKNKYLDEALTIFYQQVKNNAVIKWTAYTQAPPARSAKACEKLHKQFLLNPVANRKSNYIRVMYVVLDFSTTGSKVHLGNFE